MSWFTEWLDSLQQLAIMDWISMIAMWVIGGLLIYLAIKKDMEPTLLLPMGFGAIIVNLPGVMKQVMEKVEIGGKFVEQAKLDDFGNPIYDAGPLSTLFGAGIANELFPLILFIGIGAMIDFGPLLSNPKLMIFGAAAQFGIFFTYTMASLFFPLNEAASIAIIGAADGPTSIIVADKLNSQYMGAIMVAAYSYMALVPVVQPPVIKLLTTKKERRIRMKYEGKAISKRTKILFPIVVSVIAGVVSPQSAVLIGFLMFGNLIRECGVLDSLSETAQKVLANLITILLGITVAKNMSADKFLSWETALILGLGLVAFIFDTAGGIMFAKFLNIFLPEGKKFNPMIGAAGISAFPMSSRVVHKIGLEEDNQNFLLMHATGVNVSGQVASVIAGGMILNFFKDFI